MNKLILIIFCFTILNTIAVTKPVIKNSKIDKSKSTITYHMVHPMHNWDGVSKAVEGIVQYEEKSFILNKVAIVVKVSSFDSENSNRDSHMMEVTEAIKYPNVSFVSKSIKDDGTNLEINGDINFHGITKAILMKAQKKQIANHITVTGEFPILIEDFKIERPSLMMLKTDNEIGMKFLIEFDVN
ncbi:MAG: YceI family protein [Chitinophagaceae bacterium]